MKYNVYSVRDVAVGFGSPMLDMNDASAIRNFSMAVNAGSGTMSFQPKDYDLYKIGYFEIENGALIPLDVPVLVVSGSSVIGAKHE